MITTPFPILSVRDIKNKIQYKKQQRKGRLYYVSSVSQPIKSVEMKTKISEPLVI